MSRVAPEALARIIQELRDDRLLAAVKIYRDAMGSSLWEAKKEVEALRDQLRRGELVEPEGNFGTQPEAPGMSRVPPEALARIIQELRDDRLLAAVKIYHDAMGSSLLEAKKEVEALRDQLGRGELVEPEGDFGAQSEANYLPPGAMNDIVLALRNRRLIDAVKIYRKVMHCSLADAKREVEQIRDQIESGAFDADLDNGLAGGGALGAEGSGYTPPAVDKSSGCFGVLLLGACLGACLTAVIALVAMA